LAVRLEAQADVAGAPRVGGQFLDHDARSLGAEAHHLDWQGKRAEHAHAL
jgi:hypothetical protein